MLNKLPLCGLGVSGKVRVMSGCAVQSYRLPGLSYLETVLKRGGQGLLAEDMLAVLESCNAMHLRSPEQIVGHGWAAIGGSRREVTL